MLSTLLIKKGCHKRYATLTTLAVVWALWSFKIFIWSELYWWALKEQNNCCLQIDLIYIYGKNTTAYCIYQSDRSHKMGIFYFSLAYTVIFILFVVCCVYIHIYYLWFIKTQYFYILFVKSVFQFFYSEIVVVFKSIL